MTDQPTAEKADNSFSTPKNVVDAFLVDMIKRWPTLRENRNDALYSLCARYPASKTDQPELIWNGEGNLEFTKHSGEFSKSQRDDEADEANLIAKAELDSYEEGSLSHTVKKQMLADTMLSLRRRKNDTQFIIDSAELIVQARDHSFSATLPRDNAFQFFDEVPDNANPEWIKAFVELASDIMYFDYKPTRFHGMAQQYIDTMNNELAKAKEKARRFDIRFNGKAAEKRNLILSDIMSTLDKLKEMGKVIDLVIDVKIQEAPRE